MNQRETVQLLDVVRTLERGYEDSLTTIAVVDATGRPTGRIYPAGLYIQEKTRTWRETWILPPLREILARYAKKHGINLEGQTLETKSRRLS